MTAVLIGALYTARKLLQLPFYVLAIATPLLYLAYTYCLPFQRFYNKYTFMVYCKLVYENDEFWALFYDFCCVILPKDVMGTINYGFAPLKPEDGKLIALKPEDESDRMSLQLYYRTVMGIDTVPSLEGKTILEVSSGRAGGLNWISTNYPVKKCIGLDLSSKSIELSKEMYGSNKKLEFVVGNAEKFISDGTIEASSVDVIISVDSAHLYPHFETFVQECAKALKPGGFFCISDFMEADKLAISDSIVKGCSLSLIKQEDTTKNVIKAMAIDSERRLNEVITHSPVILKPFFKWNSGAKGSRIYKLLETGQFKAATWVLTKTE